MENRTLYITLDRFTSNKGKTKIKPQNYARTILVCSIFFRITYAAKAVNWPPLKARGRLSYGSSGRQNGLSQFVRRQALFKIPVKNKSSVLGWIC